METHLKWLIHNHVLKINMSEGLSNTLSLTGLSEKEFREAVLIPLLKAMGYHDVDHFHGQHELGKDIIAWKEDSDGAREYIAVIAKVGKVNASASSDATVIATQVRQSFGSTFLDKITGEKREIHRVIVTSNGSIKEQSRKAIKSQIDEHRRRHLRFWDKDKVEELIEKYLPEKSVPQMLTDVKERLQRLEHFRVVPKFEDDGISHLIEPKVDGVFISKSELTLPDTPEGIKTKEEIQQFVDEGGVIEIPGEYIQSFEWHEELARVFGKLKPEKIEICTLEGRELRPIRLQANSAEGPVFYDGLALRAIKSGLRRTEFQTDLNDEPLSLKIVFSEKLGQKNVLISIEFNPSGKRVRRVKQANRLWELIASGSSFTLYDLDSQLAWVNEKALSGLKLHQSEFRQYLENLDYIEQKLGWELTIPDLISDRDLLDAKELRQILENGSFARPFQTYNMTLVPDGARNLLADFPPNEKRWIRLVREESEYYLLDRKLDLGAEISILTVVLPEEEYKQVEKQIIQGAEGIKMSFHQAPESEGVRSYYLRYLSSEDRSKFEGVHGVIKNDTHS